MTGGSTHHPDTYHLAEWIARVYNHASRPPARQRDVLTALAVRYCDWGTGKGAASILGLARYCGLGRATVQRALRWAREAALLVRLRRGCRAGDGTAWPSEWQLVSPRLITPAVERPVYAS